MGYSLYESNDIERNGDDENNTAVDGRNIYTMLMLECAN